MRFLKNVACGFVFLSSVVALPILSLTSAFLIGHWVAMGTGSTIFGIMTTFFLFILFVAVSVELIMTLMKNLPFES